MREGLVIKSTGSWYKVREHSGAVVDCKIKGKFRIDNIKSTNPIAVGDKVFFSLEEDGVGTINEICERTNYIVRKSTNLSKQSHIIAANIDSALLLVTLKQPKTHSLFIDRFLVTAEAYKIPVTLVFNKIDIYSEKEMQLVNDQIELYTKIGYECIKTSTVENINIDILRGIIEGKTTALVGNSGVGKSSLINKIDPELNLKTAMVSKHNKKGQHTTTFAEMFELQNGGFIVDTPGLKAFGLLDMEKWEISHYFPEMFALLKHCQYTNCTHTHEPQCKVVEALENGEIALSRYENYLSLMDDDHEKHRKGY